MPRAGLSRDAVVEHALGILDAEGVEGLTLTAVARRAGVAVPSLYKHVDGLPELRRLLALRIYEQTTARVGAAVMGRSGEDALAAFVDEYRAATRDHPHRMSLIERVPDDSPEAQKAAAALVEVAYAVVRGFGLVGDDQVHAVRVLRAAVTGFATLESASAYQLPTSIDDSFAFLIRLLTAGLRDAAAAASGAGSG
jgi:AcrR family transcriptional regulator